ncbi:hypothetical protein NQ176_g2448 [Zarea fungicola]|uniref:Uncharacterized protein n=1 Tax=Zarea fungicola TaxID=93591 RepID=A0ACC1NPI4_9HYPO|nr:hypothetical protein NQ176_g2448 [Lecanicillium fungicola]
MHATSLGLVTLFSSLALSPFACAQSSDGTCSVETAFQFLNTVTPSNACHNFAKRAGPVNPTHSFAGGNIELSTGTYKIDIGFTFRSSVNNNPLTSLTIPSATTNLADTIFNISPGPNHRFQPQHPETWCSTQNTGINVAGVGEFTVSTVLMMSCNPTGFQFTAQARDLISQGDLQRLLEAGNAGNMVGQTLGFYYAIISGSNGWSFVLELENVHGACIQ